MKSLLLSVLFVLSCCSLLNLGGTDEDGNPKVDVDVRLIFRSIGDAAIQTWGTEALRTQAPQVMQMFDSDNNNVLTLAELEAAIDLNNPKSLTQLLVVAITLMQAQRTR